MLALPREYVGSLCEIKSLANDLLAVGRVIEIDESALEIADADENRMPLLQYRMPVKLFVHHSQLEPQVLVGTVYLSTENFVRVEEVKPLADFERRGAFRVNVDVAGRMFPLLSDEQQAALFAQMARTGEQRAEELMAATFFDVRVLDISLKGVRLESPQRLAARTKYYLEFTPHTASMGFCLEVQRVIRAPNDTVQYGCSFYDFSERQMDTLCRELFQLQRLEKNRRRNAAGAL